MAAQPLLSLQTTVPDVGAAFSNALLGLQGIESLRQAPMRSRLLEAQVSGAEAKVPTPLERLNKKDKNRMVSVVTGAAQLDRLPVADRLAAAKSRRSQLIAEAERTGETANTEDTDLFISKMEQNDVAGAQELINNTISTGRQFGIIEPLVGKTGLASAKTEILESGATIQALPSGEVEVRDPSGILATGQERLDVLQEAKTQEQVKRQRQADITVETARRVEQVKDATETANKAFGMVDKIRQNITNLRQVIPLIGEGASTGPITSLFPSFKAATIKLEQQQKRLGLDVVGAVTFGALSKGELDLAKAVALPLKLEGDELIQWTNDKIAAQDKLASYYEEQAIFLGQGNTQADWLKNQKAELKSLASEQDIRATMKANNLTRSEVIQELKRRKAGGR